MNTTWNEILKRFDARAGYVRSLISLVITRPINWHANERERKFRQRFVRCFPLDLAFSYRARPSNVLPSFDPRFKEEQSRVRDSFSQNSTREESGGGNSRLAKAGAR